MLRSNIIESLQDQGFIVKDGQIIPPSHLDKAGRRDLHSTATRHAIEKAKKGDGVGIKVESPVHEHDQVFLVTE